MNDSSNPTLSVIIVNRNTADLVVRCLDHIFHSDLPGRPEVIVVDNGSTDDSVARVKAAYPEVAIIEAGRNLGFAAANSRALERASGDFLLLVNTDALLERGCARRLLDLVRSDPSAGMVGPQLLNEDGTRQTSYEAVPTIATETLNRSLLKRLYPSRFPSKSRQLDGPEPVETLIGAVMLIRRKALEQVDGFDEDYFFFLEETDLAVRMRQAGWKVLHEPRAKAVHLQGATAKAHQEEARIEFYRSRYIFFEKHYGRVARTILTLVLTLNLTLNVLFFSVANFVTLGRVSSLNRSLRVRTALWKWHLQGCPEGPGIPRQ